MNFLFSMVIPTYNGQRTIGNLLKKLSEFQTDFKTEIIIIDSASKDQTLKIIDEFKRKINDLKLIKIKKQNFNHGLTRNLGAKSAKGKFVIFLSQDVIPKDQHFFKYFLEDFKLDKKVVAVYGRQIPTKNTPFIQRLEMTQRFDELDKLTDQYGRFEQSKINSQDDNPALSYFLFNPFVCYKRSFLLQHPFSKTDYAEDIIQAKKIIDLGLIKIYDQRCVAYHDQKLSFAHYFQRECQEIKLWSDKIKLDKKIKFLSKMKAILNSGRSFQTKIADISILLFFYLIKFTAYLGVKTKLT